MIVPSVLEIEGVRSFKERAVIRFPASGAVLITGKYAQSLVSSGSGKSTVLMAMAYALGYCPLPATELKTWGAKSLYVKLELMDGDQVVATIVRDPKLKLTTAAGTLEGVAAEEELARILKTPSFDLAKTLTYRAQREPGAFIALTDSDKKEMLSVLLGLTALEHASEKIKTEIFATEAKITTLKDRIELLHNYRFQYTEQQIKDLYDSYVAAYNRYTSIQKVDLAAAEGALAQVRLEIERCSKAAREAYAARNESSSIDRTIEQVNGSIRTLREGICYTCRQPWHGSSVAIDAAENQLSALRAKKTELDALIRAAATLEQSLPVMKEHEQAVLGQIHNATAPAQDAHNAYVASKNAYEAAERAALQYSQVLTQKTSAQAERDKTEADLVVLNHVAEVVGRNGFLSVIFDEVLTEIERVANEIMSDIPNVCEFSIRIDSTSTTKSGATKKAISVVLYKDGKEVSVKSLSGGQRCAVDLAVDLAISDAIRRRSGTNLGWIALDEAMDGLDIETKRAALDAIKSRVTGLLLVVDHSTEIKEAFETVVEIEFDGRHSKIV